MAYCSTESGRKEIYVARLSDPGSRRRVTNAGGIDPLWSRDGSRLYYYRATQGVVAMALSSAEELRFDAPELVTAPQNPEGIYGWDHAADGSSLLVQRVADPSMLRRDLRIWPNWGSTLRIGR